MKCFKLIYFFLFTFLCTLYIIHLYTLHLSEIFPTIYIFSTFFHQGIGSRSSATRKLQGQIDSYIDSRDIIIFQLIRYVSLFFKLVLIQFRPKINKKTSQDLNVFFHSQVFREHNYKRTFFLYYLFFLLLLIKPCLL